MREAAKITIVPLTDFVVDSATKCNAMRVMATALPNLQKIELGYLGGGHKWTDGEDPDEEWALVHAADDRRYSHDIEFISNFTKLRELTINNGNLFNGRYPCLFNFSHLKILKIGISNNHLKFDLEMLAGLPSLKELTCGCNHYLTGNLNSLRVLKDTLENVHIRNCVVEGNFMDLADFPHLKVLDLEGTAVTGDIRDIGENNFPSIEELFLPEGVYGGLDNEFQLISDAEDVIRTLHSLLNKRRPSNLFTGWCGQLSEDSPEWYDVDALYDDEYEEYEFLFYIRLVRAGTRVGYRWTTSAEDSCEVNWLDPEPDRESTATGNTWKNCKR